MDVGDAFWGSFADVVILSGRNFCRFPQFLVNFDLSQGHGVLKNLVNLLKYSTIHNNPQINQNQLEISSMASKKVNAEVVNA